jgi:hypothetical protein
MLDDEAINEWERPDPILRYPHWPFCWCIHGRTNPMDVDESRWNIGTVASFFEEFPKGERTGRRSGCSAYFKENASMITMIIENNM